MEIKARAPTKLITKYDHVSNFQFNEHIDPKLSFFFRIFKMCSMHLINGNVYKKDRTILALHILLDYP